MLFLNETNSCQVCRDGEQLKFLQKQIQAHILFKLYCQFLCYK